MKYALTIVVALASLLFTNYTYARMSIAPDLVAYPVLAKFSEDASGK